MFLLILFIPDICYSVAKLSSILWDPMECIPPGSSVHLVFQERIGEWVGISFSRGSSWPRDGIHVFCFSRQILYHRAAREAQLGSWGGSVNRLHIYWIDFLIQLTHEWVNKWSHFLAVFFFNLLCLSLAALHLGCCVGFLYLPWVGATL